MDLPETLSAECNVVRKRRTHRKQRVNSNLKFYIAVLISPLKIPNQHANIRHTHQHANIRHKHQHANIRHTHQHANIRHKHQYANIRHKHQHANITMTIHVIGPTKSRIKLKCLLL